MVPVLYTPDGPRKRSRPCQRSMMETFLLDGQVSTHRARFSRHNVDTGAFAVDQIRRDVGQLSTL